MSAPTLREWLAARAPQPSVTLEARLGAALSSHLDETIVQAAESCIDEAAAILDRLGLEDQPDRSSPAAARATAVELLAADALITLACELASVDCDRVDSRAAAWSLRIASHVSSERGQDSSRER